MTEPEINQYLQRLAAHLPAQLLDQGKFLVWEGRPRPSGRLSKVPVAPSSTGGWCAVSASDDRQWRTWTQAARQLRSHDLAGGLALVLSGSAFVGIDLDDCVTWVAGKPLIGSEALTVLRALGWPAAGFVEISPSGTGLHMIARGVLRTGSLRKRPGIELLDAGIITLTGKRLPGGGDLAIADGVLADLQASWVTPAVRSSSGPSRGHIPKSPERTDIHVLNRARNSRNGPKFRRLYDFGDTLTDNYPSRSEGVAGLLAMLLYWVDGDVGRAERLYRVSSLYRPELDDRPAGPEGRTRLRLTIDRVSAWHRRS